MLRNLVTPLMVVLLLLVTLTYHEKNDGQKALKKLYTMEKLVQEERDNKSLLEADWALLTRPERLQKLVQYYQGDLKLYPITAHQIVPFSKILPEDRKLPSSVNLASAYEQ